MNRESRRRGTAPPRRQRVAGRTHAEAVDHGVERNDGRVDQREAERLAPLRLIAAAQGRAGKAQRDHAPQMTATPAQAAVEMPSPMKAHAAHGHQQRRAAAHDRIGESEVAVLVRRRPVQCSSRGGSPARPSCTATRRPQPGDEDQRQRDEDAHAVDQRGVERLVAART